MSGSGQGVVDDSRERGTAFCSKDDDSRTILYFTSFTLTHHLIKTSEKQEFVPLATKLVRKKNANMRIN